MSNIAARSDGDVSVLNIKSQFKLQKIWFEVRKSGKDVFDFSFDLLNYKCCGNGAFKSVFVKHNFGNMMN